MNIFTFLTFAYTICWFAWASAAMTVAESAIVGDVPGMLAGAIHMGVNAVVISLWDR